MNRGTNGKYWRMLLTLSTAGFMLAAAIPAAAEAPSASGPAQAVKITRSEFAAAYLRFEMSMLGARLAEADEARVNREFDGLTLLFFTGNFSEAIRRLNALTDSIDPRTAAAKAPDFAFLRAQSEPLRPKAGKLRAELDALPASSPELAQASAAVKARLRVLAEPFDPENTTQLLMEPRLLWTQVEAEAGALKKGLDPFNGRKGDYWSVVKNGDREIPVRVFYPPRADLSQPLPLVIAFHGAGGDENMFMDGYGAGLIKRLAEKHKFLLVTPLTNAFSGTEMGPAFDALLTALGYDYAFDPQRVFVLGHSAGGMLTNGLLALRGEKISAAACLCGFSGFKDETRAIPRTLVIAGELDPIVSPARIEPAFKKARAAGYPVEYRLIKNFGHTLLVAKVLPDVTDWLLGRRPD